MIDRQKSLPFSPEHFPHKCVFNFCSDFQMSFESYSLVLLALWFAEGPRASLSQPIKIKTKNSCLLLPSIFPALRAGQPTLCLRWHLTGLFECLHVLQLATLVTMVLGWQLILNFARKRSNHLILFLYFQAKLTCPCCNTRKKDAILTKCFHVFCFECLKTRYDTRQRKCPKCNATFGNNDFHKIYL